MSVQAEPGAEERGRITMVQAVNVVINKRQQRVTYYDEALPGGITLWMMQIPGDTFLMGSPGTEVDRFVGGATA